MDWASAVLALLGLIGWWVKRRAERRDDPATEHRERYEEIDRQIAKGDSAETSAAHADRIAELKRERLRGGEGPIERERNHQD